jgi:hypothetical protein
VCPNALLPAPLQPCLSRSFFAFGALTIVVFMHLRVVHPMVCDLLLLRSLSTSTVMKAVFDIEFENLARKFAAIRILSRDAFNTKGLPFRCCCGMPPPRLCREFVCWIPMGGLDSSTCRQGAVLAGLLHVLSFCVARFMRRVCVGLCRSMVSNLVELVDITDQNLTAVGERAVNDTHPCGMVTKRVCRSWDFCCSSTGTVLFEPA